MKLSNLPFKTICWALIGLMYLPLFIFFWLLRIVARLLLGIAHIGTFNGRIGTQIIKSIFSFNYEVVY